MFQINSHLLYKDGQRVPFKSTPNRGGQYTPDFLILHYTAATTAESTVSWFVSKTAQASAHLLIDRNGNITQFAPFNIVCWHAGQSQWKGIIGLNLHAIGIEFVNGGSLIKEGAGYKCPVDGKAVTDFVVKTNKRGLPGVWQQYTDAQMAAGVEVCDVIKSTYKIREILGHEDIAPGRKVDPGPAFPWHLYGWGATTAIRETTADVNIRKGPGTTFESLQVLPKGTRIKEVRNERGWTFVEVQNLTPILLGWIKSDLIR